MGGMRSERHSGAGAGAWRLVLAPAVAVALAVGLTLRLRSGSPLWLDEALSVNIASLPLPDLVDALRHDGSPPLYYALLHVWIQVFGSGDAAVRALSTVLAVATLPVAHRVARRAGGDAAGMIAVLLLAACPFAVRYATETRMYALVMLLSGLWLLALQRCAESPSRLRMGAVALASGLLALTHYWTLFLLAAGGALLVVLATRGGPGRVAAVRCLIGLCSGAVLLLPWVPVMLFQLQHTGTPWARPPDVQALANTLRAWTGLDEGSTAMWTAGLAIAAGAVWALRRSGDGAREGERDGVWTRAWPYGALAAGALVLGLVASRVLESGYAVRYSSPALLPAVVCIAVGIRGLGIRVRAGAVAVLVVLGLAASVDGVRHDRRTQAELTAADIVAGGSPGDVVVYCPDQLGPAVSRELPDDMLQLAYPALDDPRLVDWVDYEQRNTAANPLAAAHAVAALARSAGAASVWLVTAPGYLTFDTQCERLSLYLGELVGARAVVQQLDRSYYEPQRLLRFDAVSR
jgi:mannosyltransferase